MTSVLRLFSSLSICIRFCQKLSDRWDRLNIGSIKLFFPNFSIFFKFPNYVSVQNLQVVPLTWIFSIYGVTQFSISKHLTCMSYRSDQMWVDIMGVGKISSCQIYILLCFKLVLVWIFRNFGHFNMASVKWIFVQYWRVVIFPSGEQVQIICD